MKVWADDVSIDSKMEIYDELDAREIPDESLARTQEWGENVYRWSNSVDNKT